MHFGKHKHWDYSIASSVDSLGLVFSKERIFPGVLPPSQGWPETCDWLLWESKNMAWCPNIGLLWRVILASKLLVGMTEVSCDFIMVRFLPLLKLTCSHFSSRANPNKVTVPMSLLQSVYTGKLSLWLIVTGLVSERRHARILELYHQPDAGKENPITGGCFDHE